ncbi:MAG: hypothetical protein LBE55_04305 [Clostridiales bacterium]|jgi:hypothetical protein|nr:hypothetical protein [Clostridiales bacterium]
MPVLDFDFVYLPEGKTEFANAHITLNIIQRDAEDYCYEVLVAATDEISQADIAKIVDELEKRRFKKMNIDIEKDCKITVTTSAKGRA